MKTNVIRLDNSLSNMNDAFCETEKFCAYQHLSSRDTLRFRLLAEEMMGMVKSIVGFFHADFWAEGDSGNCELHLVADTILDNQKRQEFLKASSSGKNIKAKGVMGKIRDVLETYMLSYDYLVLQQDTVDLNLITYGTMNMGGLNNLGSAVWSLQTYKHRVTKEKNKSQDTEEAWDELEKSIVGKLADDVQVGISGNKVEMIIFKQF